MARAIISPLGYSWCSLCKTHKLISQFNKHRGRKNGLTQYCITCSKIYSLERRARDGLKINAYLRRKRAEWKRIAFEHYSGSPPKCQCPSCPSPEMNIIFLEIDHINGLSNEELEYKKLKGTRPRQGPHMYRWLITNKFPLGFQVLCTNCNMGKRRNGGICPHLNNNLMEAA